MAKGRQVQSGTIVSDAPTGDGLEFLVESSNPYAESVDRGHRVDPRAQKLFIMAIALAVLYFAGLLVPKGVLSPVDNFNVSDGWTFAFLVRQFQANVSGFVQAISGQDSFYGNGFMSVMLRFVVIMLAGAGLALTGSVYQGTFRNPLVAPSTLGVMSGAGLGLVLWVTFFVGDEGGIIVPWTGEFYDRSEAAEDVLQSFWGSTSLALCSFVCCLAVVGIVLLVMKLAGRGNPSPLLIIILGQVVGAICGAVSNTIRYYYITTNPFGVKADLLTYTTIATFYRSFSWFDIACIGIPLGIVSALIMVLRHKMQLLAFTEGEARTMGVEARGLRVLAIVLCTLLTAIIVSFCGAVGFVGFLVPHLTRRIVGPNFKYLFPGVMLMGALFVLGAYVLVWTILGDYYIDMLGMYVSMAGAVVFMVSVLKGKGRDFGRFR